MLTGDGADPGGVQLVSGAGDHLCKPPPATEARGSKSNPGAALLWYNQTAAMQTALGVFPAFCDSGFGFFYTCAGWQNEECGL